jgi:hypothetical protein
LSFP